MDNSTCLLVEELLPPMKFKGGKTLDLVQVHWNDEHPDYMLKKYFHPFRIEAISSDCWAIETGKGEIVGTPISLARRKKPSHSLSDQETRLSGIKATSDY